MLFSGALLVGFVLFEIANTHLFSTILYTVNIGAFVWIIVRVGVGTYKMFKDLLGQRLSVAFSILVALIVGLVLFSSLEKMGRDVVHHYFESDD